MAKIEVKKAKMYEEHDKYYIDVTYLYEDDRFVKEIRFPKIHIPLTEFRGDIDHVPVDRRWQPFGMETRILLGNLSMPLCEKNGVTYEEHIIEEKVQEMTLEEIEKKLGQKIKIVSKK